MDAGLRRERGRADAADIDAAEVAQFDRLGESWWDPDGPMAKLHEINPVRLRYIRDMVARHRGPAAPSAPLGGLSMLDIGCGGGLLCEPLARLGAAVTGIDPAGNNIAVAGRHAMAMGLAIDYRQTTAEAVAEGGERFDVVLAMEVVEHVADRDAFLATACRLVAPGGLLLASTLNRTAKSYLLAIVGAEYVLRWVPRGTHRWTKFVTPDELARPVRRAGLTPRGTTGLVYDPLRRSWRLHRSDTDVNYFFAAARPSGEALSAPYRP